ncbi:GNAT family N-acetyltransferase [Mucilaginibacter sp.]|uniref:GNAT family N-acetyltransferase n=1 Tax=Mucilaginibacter sp. TaxID=1882438 RepID=UPI0025F92DFE|nr:GNAT family N-acetyltransferase [Mucilaginibacter sp.]
MNSKPATDKYTVERLTAGNLADVGLLHSTVYGKEVSPDFFEKKYNTRFTGVEFTGFIAYTTWRQPIAFYAVIPCLIKADNDVILAAQSADTMTHPVHRNRGLFVELALTTFQLCRELGIRLLFGFPNQNSLPGFVNKLGWQTAHYLDCFIIHTPNFSWNRFFGKLPALKVLYSRYQQHVLKKHLLDQRGVENSIINDGCSGVYRDENYLRYKSYNDTKVIKLGSSTLWIKISGILLIGDINLQADDFDDMMYELKKLAGKLGLKQIHFHASPGTTLHGLFAMRFKSIQSFPAIFKVLGEDLPLDKVKFTSADIDTF